MGLLDDAIREHLELKRRHGADPGEVAALEAEALGPVRREAAPIDDLEAAIHPGDAAGEPELDLLDEPDAPAHEHEHQPEHAAEHAPEPDLPGDPVPAVPPPAEDLRPPGSQQTAEYALEDLEQLGQEDEDPPQGSVPPPAQEPPNGGAIAADLVEADEEPEGDDVLEETPEFLQETPEHDRLWFEQRPPRDFDF